MKLAVVQTVTPEIASYTKYTVGVNAQYCIEKGYEYHIVQNMLAGARHPSWNRLVAVTRFLSRNTPDQLFEYDYVVVMDADAIIQNPVFRFEDIIEQAPSAHILICDDYDNGGYINCGIMIFRNANWTRIFINYWWEQGAVLKKEWEFPFEQQVLRDILEQEGNIPKGLLASGLIKIFSINTFNSHWLDIPEDNFIAHLMARSDEHRVRDLKAIFNRIYEQY